MNTKMRLLRLEKKQVDLLREIKEVYPSVDPSFLSGTISGKHNTPLAYRVREMIEDILAKWEKEFEEQGEK